jgi:putative serine protease PepD
LGKVVDMNEYETNPQRHEALSSEEPSHRPADAPRDISQPERGQSDITASLTPSEPVPASSAEPPTAPQQPVSPAHAVTPPPAAPSPWHPAAQPQSAQPYSAQPYSGAPSHPGQPQPGQPHPGQPQPGQPHPGQPLPGQPYPGQPYAGQAAYPGQTAYSASGQYPGQHADTDPAAQMPSWAQHVGTEQQPARAGGGRKVVLIGALAVILALSSGGIGAAVALAVHDDNGTIAATQTGNSAVTRVVDRSSLAEIAASVQDSVVSITTGSGEGSGVVLTADGFVLTNNHVVANATGKQVKVVFANGKSASATIVGTDPRTDLAVVKADGVTDLKPAKFGKSADMKVGDTVLALGSPLGLEGSVTAGIISAKDRTIRAGGEGQQQPNPFGEQQQQQSTGVTSMSGLLQTDAPINPGNSGGALVNVAGEVIGINTAIATSGQGAGSIGLGFAIPSDKAYEVQEQLKTGQKVSHPALGVSVGVVEGGGAGIKEVVPNSAAAKAGLQQGDIITEINGKPVNDSDDVVAAIQAGKVGDQVTVTYTRNGARKTATATLAEAS